MIKKLLIGAFFFIGLSYSQPPPDVSATDEVFFLLRRNQTQAQTVYPAQNAPQSRDVYQNIKNSPTLSAYDQYTLKHQFPFGGKPLLNWRDTVRQHTFFLSPQAFVRWLDTGSTQSIQGVGMRIHGSLFKNLAFYSHGLIYTENSNTAQYSHQFDPDYGETCSVEQMPDEGLVSSQTCARFEYYLRWDLPYLKIKAGRDNLHMGPGYFTSLTASRNTAPYYHIEGRIDFSDWFVLDNYFLQMTDTDHSFKKWAHIHRFEFTPHSSLSLAFQDVVIYQERSPDFTYMLPLVPLAFAEDNSGGLDNDAMSFDFLYTGLPYFSTWGELFIDDLQGPTTFFDDLWENRWATLVGFQVTSPLKAVDADFVFEYSRVEPWTYNGRQRYTSFRHYNRPSASQWGPDSRTFDFKASYRPFKEVEWTEHFEIDDKGQQPGASQLGEIHDNEKHGTRKRFLAGNFSHQISLSHGLRLQWHQFLTGYLTYTQSFRGGIENHLKTGLNFYW